ncbi:glycosyltransferase [Glaciihabitans arcticus]|uniref:Glycosyltransferase n=1 Tax=Glaciihabitans arcticus TaxID=2668039 RepID=A0A4Q9GMF5_9MICO|nr:glycosyltransferase family 2 protein [Glaciihabitans arcticus]TBN55952.1 glycosyltransferase [Glaciihabitans arcticus]
MTTPVLVDAILPVHDATRPLDRALASLLVSGLELGSELRITVVCHNISADEIRAALPAELRDVARFLEHPDGLPSPAGPKNLALDQTDGTYIAFLDSDDSYDPGALRDWVDRAEAHNLDAVIPPERHDDGRVIRTPVVRRLHSGDLDPIRDRLSYRTAPLGLLRRSTVERLGLRFAGGLRNGSDQIFGLTLWFDSPRVRFARGGPGYIVGGDAQTRVTTQTHPVASELKATHDMFAHEWFLRQSLRVRRAIVVKSVRILFFGALAKRLDTGTWTTETQRDSAAFLELAARSAPGYERSLSIADLRAIDAVLEPGTSLDRLTELARARRAFGHPTTVLTRDLRGMLLPDAPLRFMAASLLH